MILSRRLIGGGNTLVPPYIDAHGYIRERSSAVVTVFEKSYTMQSGGLLVAVVSFSHPYVDTPIYFKINGAEDYTVLGTSVFGVQVQKRLPAGTHTLRMEAPNNTERDKYNLYLGWEAYFIAGMPDVLPYASDSDSGANATDATPSINVSRPNSFVTARIFDNSLSLHSLTPGLPNQINSIGSATESYTTYYRLHSGAFEEPLGTISGYIASHGITPGMSLIAWEYG